MSYYTYPKPSGGGGGPATINYPLVGPAGSAGAPTFGITGAGGLYGYGSGGIGLSVQGGITAFTSDGQGNVNLPHMLTVLGEALFPGGVNAAGVLAQTLTVQQNANIAGGLGVGGDANLTGNLAAHDISASGTISGSSLAVTGSLSGDSLNVAKKGKFGSLEVSGVFTAGSLQSTGPVLIPTAGPDAPGLALSEEPNTGIFGAPTGTIGVAVRGNVVATLSADLSLALAGAVSGKAATFDSLTASGPSVLGDLETVKLVAQGNVKLLEDLDVSGYTTLAHLVVDSLNTPGDASVGGSLSVGHLCQISGATTLQDALSVAGSSSLAGLRAAGTILGTLRVPGGGGTVPVVDQDPVTREYYSALLDGGGNLALSGNVVAHGNATVAGLSAQNLTVSGPASIAGLATFGSGGSFGSDLSVAGSVEATAEVGGASLRAGARQVLTGSGVPNGQVAASPASVYGDTQSGTVWVKMAGIDKNGWVAVSTSSSSLTYPIQAPAGTDPSYAFATSTGDGMGSTQANSLYFSVGHQPIITVLTSEVGINANLSGQNASFQSLLVATNARFNGDAVFAGTLTAATATITGYLSGQTASFSGNVSGHVGSFDSLQVGGTGQVNGAFNVYGTLESADTLTAPRLVLGGSKLSAGAGDPNGVLSGSPGDLYLQNDGGALWVKVSGTATSANWAKVPTSGSLTFPLQAPDGSPASPSYGFAQGGLGITATGTQTLAGITGGITGWTLDANQKMALAGALSVAGASTLTGLSATSIGTTGPLSVGGTSTLQAITGTTLTLTAAATLSATLDVAGRTTVGGALAVTGAASASSITSGGSGWTSGASAPSGSGNQGDFASVTSGSKSFVVYTGGVWKQVQYLGDPAPANFPLRGPADSAAAPNFAPRSTSPGSGLFGSGTDQIGLATAGVQALGIDASQNVTFAAALTGNAAAFTSITCSGAASIQGTATLGGSLNLTGPATFSSTLSSGAITSSGTLTVPAASISGLLSAGTLTTSSNASIGGNLTVAGTTTFTGVQRLGFIQTGDGLVSQPAISYQSEQGLGIYRAGAGQWAVAGSGANLLVLQTSLATFQGAIRVGNTNAGLVSPAANTLALQTAGNTALTIAPSGIASFAFQAQVTAGTAAAPGLSVGGSTTGLTSLTAFTSPAMGFSLGGVNVATLTKFSGGGGGTGLAIGPASDFASGGIVWGPATSPNGQLALAPGNLFSSTSGGAGTTVWVKESGTAATGWASILTSSSTIMPAFPIQSPTLGSASAPTYGFSVSGYTSTGVYGVADAGSGNIPAIAMAANGVTCAYFDSQTANSLPVYNFIMGNPAINSSPYPVGIRASAQAASGNIVGAVGQLAINNVGGPGTILAVKETGVGTTTGWAPVYTSGTAQLAGAAGTVGAPYHAFSNSVSSGLSYAPAGGLQISVAGTLVFNIGTAGAAFSTSYVQFPAGTYNQPGIVFNNASTTGFYSTTIFGNPSIFCSLGGTPAFGFTKYSGANNGMGLDVGPSGNFLNGGLIFSPNLPTGTASTSPGTVFVSTGGTIWLKESGASNATGYAQILTTSTAPPVAKLTYQAAAPAAVSSVGQIYSLTSDGNLYYTNGAGKQSNLSSPSLAPPTSNTAPAATITTVAADAYRTFVNNATTASNVTLYTVPAGSDYPVSFIVGSTGGFSITAPSSQVIYVGTTATVSSLIASSTPGSTITLFNPGGLGVWYATQVSGQWDVT